MEQYVKIQDKVALKTKRAENNSALIVFLQFFILRQGAFPCSGRLIVLNTSVAQLQLFMLRCFLRFLLQFELNRFIIGYIRLMYQLFLGFFIRLDFSLFAP